MFIVMLRHDYRQDRAQSFVQECAAEWNAMSFRKAIHFGRFASMTINIDFFSFALVSV